MKLPSKTEAIRAMQAADAALHTPGAERPAHLARSNPAYVTDTPTRNRATAPSNNPGSGVRAGGALMRTGCGPQSYKGKTYWR
jgi:hypothetical protein